MVPYIDKPLHPTSSMLTVPCFMIPKGELVMLSLVTGLQDQILERGLGNEVTDDERIFPDKGGSG